VRISTITLPLNDQQSILSESELENVDHFCDLLRENPSASMVIDLISRQYPLNRKQRLVAERVISEALAWKDHPFDASKRNQSLVYIGGEGGTGKSQIVRAVVAAMILLGRLEEIILMAPTGAAADNIDGNTYHTSLGISIRTNHQERPRNGFNGYGPRRPL
jgi:AAA domain